MFVPTKAAAKKNNGGQSHEHVVFRKKVKNARPQIDVKPSRATGRKDRSNECGAAELRKLRFEIIKFGMTGFEGEDKDQANVEFMVSLGAKRPKNKAKNYKELLIEKDKEKQRQTLSMEAVEKCNKRLLPSNKNLSILKSRKRKRKEVKGLLNVYGEVKVRKKIRKRQKKK